MIRLICILACATFLFSSCADDDASSERKELSFSVYEPGEYRVGFQEGSVTYRPKGLSEDRTLTLGIWYPSPDEIGDRPGLFGSEETMRDATIMEGNDYPVVVFSHGTSGFAESFFYQTEFLASHGYIVVACNHTGDTTSNVNDFRETEMYLVRPQDVSAMIDWVYSDQMLEPLQGKLSDKLALIGHSYGGWTSFVASGAEYSEEAIASCDTDTTSSWCVNMNDEYRELFRGGFKDNRIKALIPMAPGNHGEIAQGGVGAIDIPVFLMTASGDKRCPNETQGNPYWEELQGDQNLRINFPTGGHHSFILTCGFAPSVGENDGCGEGFIDYIEALRLVNIYGLAFIRHHLYGDTSVESLLNGTETLSDDIDFSSK